MSLLGTGWDPEEDLDLGTEGFWTLGFLGDGGVADEPVREIVERVGGYGLCRRMTLEVLRNVEGVGDGGSCPVRPL